MKPQLYFDGKCPLCRREVRWLKALAGDRLEFVDVHRALVSETERTAMLQWLHLKQPDGTWLTGLEANVGAWQYTALGFLWAPLRWPVIRPLARRAYNHWAWRRSQRCDWVPAIPPRPKRGGE
ncbi:DUF393 domain-containing protein [Gilvimarinus agarilyticus]|uniref:thiol-disulfide oxidoreductase DCC family protein n=1 Tax=Gilvimarinus sp. 2_MG-2023 TaxID=3062666 RepID=UPI001C08D6B3|nr:DUF393 domain-containing protein [Gilvimarinus sp. 2_MG-2023]MBU2885596.1 DUF393 domain-containing protein [Gilvimarinus agarilyticus]MDO6570463.1 DUF393 domain-containing protein [Gilvimarinus sp. 2_MG-2023]